MQFGLYFEELLTKLVKKSLYLVQIVKRWIVKNEFFDFYTRRQLRRLQAID